MLQCEATTKGQLVLCQWPVNHCLVENLLQSSFIMMMYVHIHMHLCMCSMWPHAMVRPTSARVDLVQLSNSLSTLEYTYVHTYCKAPAM